jgi:hypothetical protein
LLPLRIVFTKMVSLPELLTAPQQGGGPLRAGNWQFGRQFGGASLISIFPSSKAKDYDVFFDLLVVLIFTLE